MPKSVIFMEKIKTLHYPQAHKKHPSSIKVMFSDRGSILFGVVLVFLMVTLSATYFFVKMQKTPTFYLNETLLKKTICKQLPSHQPRLSFNDLKSKHFLLFYCPKKVLYKTYKPLPSAHRALVKSSKKQPR